jgi:hypothetical protein
MLDVLIENINKLLTFSGRGKQQTTNNKQQTTNTKQQTPNTKQFLQSIKPNTFIIISKK